MVKKTSEKPLSDKDEIIRHFDIVAEDLKSTISQVAEGVSTNADLIQKNAIAIQKLHTRVDVIETQLDNLGGMRSSVESMRDDVLKIRVRLETLQNKVEKNPTYHDLSALDKRVWVLEKKINQGK